MPTDVLTVEPIIIDLNPEWFKPGYYVYVVEAKSEKQKYYYVGMTGDRKHLVARSPFYRMGGHFTLSESSTQNQIIKGLKAKAGVLDVVTELPLWKFTYYAYLLAEFVPHQETHDKNRVFAERTETELMKLMKEPEFILFNTVKSNKTKDEYAGIKAAQIFENLKQQLG